MGILSQSVVEYTSHYFKAYPPALIEQDIEGYVEDVRDQRGRLFNRDKQKYESSISGYQYPRKTLAETLDDLYRDTYIYCGVKRIEASLYREYPYEDLYYEFLTKDRDVALEYGSWQYIYIPISQELKPGYVPTIFYWDTEELYGEHKIPDYDYLINLEASSWPHQYTLLTESLGHPYLGPTFVFTGSIVQQGDDSVLYEYVETDDHYSSKGSKWLSPLRPFYLDFPFGIPQEQELEKDNCLSSLTGLSPKKGSYPFIGTFTGYTTTKRYNPTIKFYLYERQDGSTFLLEEEPHQYSRLFINLTINEASLHIIAEEASQSIEIIEDSCEVYIAVETNVNHLVPDFVTLKYNDCNIIGDSFLQDFQYYEDGDEWRTPTLPTYPN